MIKEIIRGDQNDNFFYFKENFFSKKKRKFYTVLALVNKRKKFSFPINKIN